MFIDRSFLNTLIRLSNTPDMKIITGVHVAGKSTLLNQFKEYVSLNEQNTNIIYIDFTHLGFKDLLDYLKLNEYIESCYIPNTRNLLIIDEIQMCPKFELTINSLCNKRKYDIYLTGSNAFLLSSDLATYFTGRYLDLSIFPFSFKEYCSYFNITSHRNDYLEKYLMVGGLAGSYNYNNQEDAYNYVRDVYNTFIKRDIVDKFNITDISLLDNILEYLMDNIGNLTSTNNIASILSNNKLKTNHVTVMNYIKYLCNAFVFYKVKRYDIKGKKYLNINDKYYLVDLSFRFAILGLRNIDIGRSLENIVAIELLRRGYNIYVGVLYNKEVDFVVMKSSEKFYIQVCDNISNKETLDRELAPLFQIRDNYPKFILANTRCMEYDIEGIRIVDIADWLINY